MSQSLETELAEACEPPHARKIKMGRPLSRSGVAWAEPRSTPNQGLPRPPPLIPFGRGFRFGEWHENWFVYFSESATSEML
jgi:hypothetical protein